MARLLACSLVVLALAPAAPAARASDSTLRLRVSLQTVFMSADVALYQAKHLGRDRVVMASVNKVDD